MLVAELSTIKTIFKSCFVVFEQNKQDKIELLITKQDALLFCFASLTSLVFIAVESS